jgi:simple sugar transport system ATP-binding protein
LSPGDREPRQPTNVLVELRNVSKRFGPVEALRDVDLHLDDAEALGLIGDNGAGKSTLVKILSGVYAPSSGEMLLDGHKVEFSSPLDARGAGIEMIYQDLALCDDLDVTSNVFLGRETRRRVGLFSVLDNARMRRETRRSLQELRSTIDPERGVASLSGGERQLVAVARALQFSPRAMLMDEPTAALSTDKIHMLLSLVERLKERGVAVLLISHRFTDILHVCDRVVVLRQGEVVGTVDAHAQSEEATIAIMHELMTGDVVGAA